MITNVKDDVKNYFISKEYKIINFENSYGNPASPIYSKWSIAPSTGFEGDLFEHGFYKVDIIKPNSEIETNWVDCLYFLKIKCWFVVKKDIIENSPSDN